MQVTETHTEGLKREYKVVIAAQDIDEKMELRLQQIAPQIKVPGFRPGKVPLKVLKQRFGPSVMGEVLEAAVKDSSLQALSERGLRPAMEPKIEITDFDQGKDLEYTMAIELLPEIAIMDFGKIALERLKIEVPESEVGEALERMAKVRKQTEPLAEARPAAAGDVLVIDFHGTVDGEAQPGMAGDDHHLELGSSQFIEGFEDQLIGAEKGESRQVTVRFPEGYANDKLAGREAVFDVKVKDILAAVPQPIDDALAQAMGEDSLDSLKARVRQEIEREYRQLARNKLKRALLDKLAEGHDFPVPAGMVEAEFDTIWTQIEADRREGHLDPDDEGKSDDELKAEYRNIAERRVRLGLLLSEVGRQNTIEVTQEEVNQALMREAQRYPGQESRIFELYQNSQEMQANLRAPIFEDKVIDFITDLAEITERSVTVDELRSELEAEEGAAAPTGEGDDT